MLNQQSEIEKEFESKKVIRPICYDINVEQFLIPSTDKYKETFVSLSEKASADEKLMFSAIYSANYLYFYTDKFACSIKYSFGIYAARFIRFISEYKFNKDNRISVLKDYETYRVTVDGVKSQTTGMVFIKKCIRDALDFIDFRSHLDDIEYAYLHTLLKTKAAPYDDITQVTMTDWFSNHAWLRRDDIGVGHNLFTQLASPKSLTSSFRITVTTALLEIQAAKHVLISLFKENEWALNDIPEMYSKEEYDNQNQYNAYCSQYFAELMNRLIKEYNEYKGDKSNLESALKIIISEVVQYHSQDYVFECLQLNSQITYKHKKRIVSRTTKHPSMFPLPFLREVLSYSKLPANDKKTVPICKAEYVLFSWLMAYQTVQPSDIGKLKSNDFKFIRRRNGIITHIDLDYFKGRSRTIHTLKTIEANTDFGKAILMFLQDKGDFDMDSNPMIVEHRLGTGDATIAAKLIRYCDKWLRDKIEEKLSDESVSIVFLDAMSALLKNGIKYEKKTHGSPAFYYANIDAPLMKNFFSLSAIKNSSIHSRSDSFTPTQLLNYHSHTNETERDSYLSPENEEWLNNCGRITRAVMQDLTVNLFRASDENIKEFNCEFMKSANIIGNKCNDILSRMKLITGKQDGRINELGFVSSDNQSDIAECFDNIYLLDSPDTVMKLKHYLSEVKKKNKNLLNNAPEYFLFTVLSTVEWIEILFEQRKFRKKSLLEGGELYNKYKEVLPPLFTAQMGS